MKDDNYGKLRTCGYYPIQILNTDKDGKLVDDNLISDGAEIDFINILTSDIEVNNNDEKKQVLEIPQIPEIKKQKILDRIDEIKSQLKAKLDVKS